jgi:lycopene cyclase domain-containing protein
VESALKYILLDMAMLLLVGLVAWGLQLKLSWRPLHVVFGILFVLTMVFDNLLIAMDTFRYHTDLMSGWLIGRAPIEDFAYILAATLLLPTLWEYLRKFRK